MAKLALAQLEQTTEIPAGSLHLVEMGDGSGTKTVTQETMVKETGKALKIGNMEELQTENKTSIVAAINEVQQSGGSGGTSVDILDSQEEIEANTEAGKAAGALAVQEMFGALNDKLGLETRENPDDSTQAQWKNSNGDWVNFRSTQSFTVNLTAGYVQAATFTYSSSIKFQNAKIKINVSSFSGGGYLSVKADSQNTNINKTGDYTFEGESIIITANKSGNGHTDSTSATLNIELST